MDEDELGRSDQSEEADALEVMVEVLLVDGAVLFSEEAELLAMEDADVFREECLDVLEETAGEALTEPHLGEPL